MKFGLWLLGCTSHQNDGQTVERLQAWSPDGLELVTGDQVGKVRLWRAGDKAAGV